MTCRGGYKVSFSIHLFVSPLTKTCHLGSSSMRPNIVLSTVTYAYNMTVVATGTKTGTVLYTGCKSCTLIILYDNKDLESSHSHFLSLCFLSTGKKNKNST